MLMDEARDAIRVSVAKTGQILRLSHIAFFDAAANQIYGSLQDSGISHADLIRVAETGEPIGEGNSTVVPVRLGAHLVGSLALQGARLSPNTRNSIASLLAINYERVRALDRAAAAEVARRNEEFKSSLLDGLAHDLKTPLTAIRTCVTRLISIPPRTEEVRQELLSIIDEASRAACSIRLPRPSSWRGSNRRNCTFIASRPGLRAWCRPHWSETRDESPGRYAIDIPADLTLDIDPDLFRRALMQLLENAHKYSPPGFAYNDRSANQRGRCDHLGNGPGPGHRPGRAGAHI